MKKNMKEMEGMHLIQQILNCAETTEFSFIYLAVRSGFIHFPPLWFLGITDEPAAHDKYA